MFKKTVMAAAIAAVASAPAMAAEWKMNDDTKFAVNIDVGMYYLDSQGSDSEFKGDGVNQVEIKGQHKIDDTITVFGEIEFEYDPSEGESAVLTDDMKVGIKHANLGTFTFGQFDSYYEDKIAEALQAEHGDTGKLEESDVIDDDNRLAWYKSFGDTTFAVDLSFDQSDAVSTERSFVLRHKMGDVTFSAGAGKEKNERENMGANVAYKMSDDTKFVLSYVVDETSAGAETSYAGFLVTHQFGATDVFVAMQNVDDDGTENTEWGVGVGHEIAKDLLVYADYIDRTSQDEQDLEIGIRYEF
jgi:predicted porin